MPRTPVRLFAAAALALVLAGCAFVPLRPKGIVDVPVQSGFGPAEAKVAPLNEVTIHLAPVNDVRNQWAVVLNDTRFLRQLRPIERRPDGSFVASFLALKPGRRTIRLLEMPVAGRETVALQSYDVIVEIE